MVPYANNGGDSNVEAYEINDDSILVRFNGGSTTDYVYSCNSCGQENVAKMKELAAQGEGLNSFIMNHVKNDYESKR